ncbi:hypothetical protein D3C81_1291460 [compost metagenome]
MLSPEDRDSLFTLRIAPHIYINWFAKGRFTHFLFLYLNSRIYLFNPAIYCFRRNICLCRDPCSLTGDRQVKRSTVDLIPVRSVYTHFRVVTMTHAGRIVKLDFYRRIAGGPDLKTIPGARIDRRPFRRDLQVVYAFTGFCEAIQSGTIIVIAKKDPLIHGECAAFLFDDSLGFGRFIANRILPFKIFFQSADLGFPLIKQTVQHLA